MRGAGLELPPGGSYEPDPETSYGTAMQEATVQEADLPEPALPDPTRVDSRSNR